MARDPRIAMVEDVEIAEMMMTRFCEVDLTRWFAPWCMEGSRFWGVYLPEVIDFANMWEVCPSDEDGKFGEKKCLRILWEVRGILNGMGE